MSDEQARVQGVRPSPTCPICYRDLEVRVEARGGGKVHIALACVRHGSFPKGWRPKFIDHARAAAWAARQQQLTRRR